MLTRVNEDLFLCHFFLSYFVLLYLTGYELRYIVCLFLRKIIFFPGFFYSLFFLNLIHLLLFSSFLSSLSKINLLEPIKSIIRVTYFFLKKNIRAVH